jgi:hypothetical protein
MMDQAAFLFVDQRHWFFRGKQKGPETEVFGPFFLQDVQAFA